jgi:hypothetical protein
VAGGHRYQVGEALERDGVAVVDQLRDGLGQRGDAGSFGYCSVLAQSFAMRTNSAFGVPVKVNP